MKHQKQTTIHTLYIAIGLFNKIQGLIILSILVEIAKLQESRAFMIVFAYSVMCSFFLNERIAFKKRGYFMIFVLVTLCSFTINIFIFNFLNIKLPYLVASVATSCIAYPFHFFANQKITYRRL